MNYDKIVLRKKEGRWYGIAYSIKKDVFMMEPSDSPGEAFEVLSNYII